MKIIKKNTILGLVLLSMLFYGCMDDFLDVIPDNIADIESVFNMRNTAERFLATCYSYMTHNGNLEQDPAMFGGDEIWANDYATNRGVLVNPLISHVLQDIAYNRQNKLSPILSNWSGYYKAIRDCNIFLDNINRVPDIQEEERQRWIGEVLFLKAYYHYMLIKMYGPISIIKENLPIDIPTDQVRVSRNTVDESFGYVIELLNNSINTLGIYELPNPYDELGRVTVPIAKTLKAEVTVFRASPLFNGNTDMAALKNHDGTQLFPQTENPNLWIEARDACRDAIDACDSVGINLYEYVNVTGKPLSSTILHELTLRNVLCEKWNSEIIWGNTNSYSPSRRLQQEASPFITSREDNFEMRAELGAPLGFTELYYTENGLPLKNDVTWDYKNRYELVTADENNSNPLQIVKGAQTAGVHFNREPRYYANLGFHQGVWYGQGKLDESDLHHIETTSGANQGFTPKGTGSVTGMYIKKVVHYENVENYYVGSGGHTYTTVKYPFPIFRLADLYLLYAEALNESGEDPAEVCIYLNKVRQRAGIPDVEISWGTYSNEPAKFQNQDGLREIIQQDRAIELAFEGKRFWDLRRWKTAPRVMNQQIYSWNKLMRDPVLYHKRVSLYSQTFGLKDYFWPINDRFIEQNPNLVQNLGW